MSKVSSKLINDLKSTSKEVMEVAFNQIYNTYSYLIFYISLQIVKDNEIAKDITNETFYKMFINKDKIDNNKNLKYYLTTICKNLSINYLNSKKNEKEYLEGIIVNDNRVDHFDEYIDKFKDFLNQEELDLIIYHLLYDYSFKEIALMKNVTTSVVSSKYRRTIIKVRNHYKGGKIDE